MPGLTPDGKRVSIAGASPDFHLTNVADLFKLLTMMADVRLHAEKFGVAGDVYILDAAATSLTRQFLKMSPVLLKEVLRLCPRSLPCQDQRGARGQCRSRRRDGHGSGQTVAEGEVEESHPLAQSSGVAASICAEGSSTGGVRRECREARGGEGELDEDVGGVRGLV
jgi:hypothetical protein